jgi:hypothetical protein
MRTSSRRAARVALGTAGGVVALLGLAQLLLPGIAAQRVRSQLGRYGAVRSVSVSAFPAIELLWGHAQSATVRAGALSIGVSQASQLLWQGRGVERFDLRAASMALGPLTMHDVSFQKRGAALYTQGTLSEAALRSALPGSTSVQPLESTPSGVEVRVSGSLFGVGGSVDVLLSAQEGKLLAQPQGIPFGGLIKVTLLSDPHVYVQSFELTGSPTAGGVGGSPNAEAGAGEDPIYTVRITARLR